MARVRPRKVKILEETSKFMTLLFIDHHCQIQIPKKLYIHRMELGLYLVINPNMLKTVL
jgi:hypothetical protein